MDLFDFAREREAAPAPRQNLLWEEPGETLWGRTWLEHARRVCTPKYASELAFGEKLLGAGRLRSCRVRGAHCQTTFTNREGGMALVNLTVRPLSPEAWRKIGQLCDGCGDALFASDELPDDIVSGLFEGPDGLLPEWADLAFSCSHCHTPFCLYRAATLFALATEFERAPIKLFELRGAPRDLLFMRAAQQAPEEKETQLGDADLSELFGVDLV